MDKKHTAIEWEQVGEIIVVKLSATLLTPEQCRSMHDHFQRLIEDHHCDFILDCAEVEIMATVFFGRIVRLLKQAKAEAEKRGKEYRPVAVPLGYGVTIFDDRETALKEMAKHDGHGWVVFCSVPPVIRELLKLV